MIPIGMGWGCSFRSNHDDTIAISAVVERSRARQSRLGSGSCKQNQRILSTGNLTTISAKLFYNTLVERIPITVPRHDYDSPSATATLDVLTFSIPHRSIASFNHHLEKGVQFAIHIFG